MRRRGRYVAVFENGSLKEGAVFYPKGSMYVGSFVGAQRRGLGVLVPAEDGAVYAGEWMADKRHGLGTEYDPLGVVVRGRYEDDRLVEKLAEWTAPVPVVPAVVAPRSLDRDKVLQLVSPAQPDPVSVWPDLWRLRQSLRVESQELDAREVRQRQLLIQVDPPHLGAGTAMAAAQDG
jgi:hypothetical protein